MKDNQIRLLIAEDNDADVFLIREALDQSGLNYEADVASNGEKALAYIDRIAQTHRQLDGLILDLNLTTHSGLEILKYLHGIPGLGGLRIVVLTSSDSPSDRQGAESLGTHLYLRKPMDFDQFMKIGRQIAGLMSDRAASHATGNAGHGPD